MKPKKKEIFTLKQVDNKSDTILNSMKHEQKVSHTHDDKNYIQQPLLDSSNRKNIHKFKHLKEQYHKYMQSGIELGPNYNNEILKLQFAQSTLINTKLVLLNRQQPKNQSQINETDLFMTQDHNINTTIPPNNVNQSASAGIGTGANNNDNHHFRSHQEPNRYFNNRNSISYQPLENSYRGIVNLNKYGKIEIKEVVNLAKSYLLSDNQKDLKQLMIDRNNFVMGKSISSLTHLAKKRDYNSLKYLKQFNKEHLTPYQQLMVNHNETRNGSSSSNLFNKQKEGELSDQLSKHEFRKNHLEDTNYSFMQVGSMQNQQKEPTQIQK